MGGGSDISCMCGRGGLLLARVCRISTMGHAHAVLIDEGREGSRAGAFGYLACGLGGDFE